MMNNSPWPDMYAEQSRDVSKRQYGLTKEKKRKFKFFNLFLLLVIILGIIGSTCLIAIQYDAKYHDDLALANTGIKHLQAGISLMQRLSKNPLDASTTTQAQQEFASSYRSFTQLEIDLKSLPAVLISTPIYGTRLSAALHLIPLAIEISQAGIVGCNALSLFHARFHEPLTTEHGITMSDLTVFGNDLHQLQTILNQATTQVKMLQPSDLQFDPRISKAVKLFHIYLPLLQSSLNEFKQLLPALPALLGINSPANYLVEVLDSTELRPGGGFVGNYGIATLTGGRLTAAHITDTYLIDNAFTASGHSISYPSAYAWFDLAPASWSMRDSNLDADFPTSAKNIEQNYKIEGGSTSVQGVIAITPFLIQQALTITGPIAVPEYNEIITTQNLIDRIHYYQVGAGRQGKDTPSPDGNSSVRKHFVALLAEHFLARIHQLPSSTLPKFFQLLINSMQTKDVQLYFNSPSAESLLSLFHLDSSIQAPTGDSLFIVDANISPNKASQLITNTLKDQVSIDEQGNIVHHTTITYDWTTNGQVYGSPLYRDYIRIYLPQESILQEQQGWQPRGTGTSFGRAVWAGFFTLIYGQTRILSFTWKEKAGAKKNRAEWYYQYLIQHQAGTHWNTNIQVMLPSCATKMSVSGGLMSKGKQEATFSQSLTKDTSLSVDYNC